MTYFVWISGLRGPEAQLWASEPVDGNGKPIKGALFKQKLTVNEEKLSLNKLADRFRESLSNETPA